MDTGRLQPRRAAAATGARSDELRPGSKVRCERSPAGDPVTARRHAHASSHPLPCRRCRRPPEAMARPGRAGEALRVLEAQAARGAASAGPIGGLGFCLPHVVHRGLV